MKTWHRAPRSEPSALNLSVEQESLAAIPFAVLERRIGKRIGKIQINGTKLLQDGTEVRVTWQVQGNNELGLPTEQDLDIFVALGVLTYRNNFAKTVMFTGRELAHLLNITSVHGKFYQRLKLAMDRFIPLRFRALTATDHHEEVKWLNVFQEFSVAVDHTSGRLTGTVTWTDKLIRAMDSGLFRMLDAGKYMELDGITAKHLYRFLVLAFERSDLLLIDARQLATEHLGILSLPKYFSRLMQTLEPAFEQLRSIEVLASWHIVSSSDWRLALRRHPMYRPAGRTLEAPVSEELTRAYCHRLLEAAGFRGADAAKWCARCASHEELYSLDRAARMVEEIKRLGVARQTAFGLVERALELGASSGAGRELLDWYAIAVEACRESARTDPGAMFLKIVEDTRARRRLVSREPGRACLKRLRQIEEMALRYHQGREEHKLILDYEQFRLRLATRIFQDLPETTRRVMLREKPAAVVIEELAAQEAPPYEKWRLRMRAQQVVQPFGPEPQADDRFAGTPAPAGNGVEVQNWK